MNQNLSKTYVFGNNRFLPTWTWFLDKFTQLGCNQTLWERLEIGFLRRIPQEQLGDWHQMVPVNGRIRQFGVFQHQISGAIGWVRRSVTGFASVIATEIQTSLTPIFDRGETAPG